jgi:hypothetical protein
MGVGINEQGGFALADRLFWARLRATNAVKSGGAPAFSKSSKVRPDEIQVFRSTSPEVTSFSLVALPSNKDG